MEAAGTFEIWGGGGCSFVHKVVMKFYQVPWNLEIPMEVLVVPEWDLVY